MGKTLLTRLAAVAAGGTMALAGAAPAIAHDTPAAGFNAVLHAPHHNVAVDSDAFPEMCEEVEKASPDLVEDGFDVWVFNIPSGEFDTGAATIASIQFSGGTIEVPDHADHWIGPAANPHLLAVAVPAGWTLLDGDFNVTGTEDKVVVVTHTCPGQPGNGETPPPGNGETPPPGNGETPPPGENGEGGENGDDDEEGLPVTGIQVGGLVVLGAGLLAAGVALLAIRRRHGLPGMTDG